jgi:hypothetical protein
MVGWYYSTCGNIYIVVGAYTHSYNEYFGFHHDNMGMDKTPNHCSGRISRWLVAILNTAHNNALVWDGLLRCAAPQL